MAGDHARDTTIDETTCWAVPLCQAPALAVGRGDRNLDAKLVAPSLLADARSQGHAMRRSGHGLLSAAGAANWVPPYD